MSIEFYWVGLALTLIISVARITRLITHDTFPPVRWLREQYMMRTIDTGGWDELAWCVYCAGWWISALVTGVTSYFAGVYTLVVPTNPSLSFTLWWLFFGSFAVAYLAAIFVSNDSDDSESQAVLVKPAPAEPEDEAVIAAEVRSEIEGSI